MNIGRILLPTVLVMVSLIIASCVNDEPNGNDFLAPHFDETQDIEYYYDDGYFHYSFMVETPTPCYAVETEELILESDPEQVAVNVVMRDTGGVCAQVVTSVEVSGSIPLSSKPASFTILLKDTEAYSAIMDPVINDDWRIESVTMSRHDSGLDYGFTLNLPNPCYSYEVDEIVSGNTLDLMITIIPPKDDMICIQVIEQKRVEGSIPTVVDSVNIFIDEAIVYTQDFE